MSGWELFTWFNVGVLAGGSALVFAFFVRDVSKILPPSRDAADDDDPSQ